MPPTLQKNKSSIQRVSMLLWGSAGCGKTWFANTAPGARVFINFDPEGTSSLPDDDDTLVVDYSNEPDRLVEEVKSGNPFNLEGHFKERPDIQTVVVDSVTKFAQSAVAYSLGRAPGAVFENPGPAGYGFRNRFSLALIKSVLLVTGKHNKHVIFVCHEDVPKTNSQGEIQLVTILLGGSLPEEVPLQISEVWHVKDKTTQRVVTVRPVGLIKPMKSRMFNAESTYDFVISDKSNSSKVTLAALFDRWRENKYNKIDLPK